MKKMVATRRFAILIICILPALLAGLITHSRPINFPFNASIDNANEINATLRYVLNARYPNERAFEDGYRKLFTLVGPTRLKALQNHTDDSMALQAAWEQVEMTIPVENTGPVIEVDRKLLERFLQFMEKRCKLSTPDWWRKSFLKAKANRRRNIYLPPASVFDQSHELGIDRLGGSLDTSLTRHEASVTIKTGNDSLTIPQAQFAAWQKGDKDSNLSTLFTPDRSYFAFHHSVGFPYQLVCLSRDGKKVLWDTEVWGCWWGGASGMHWGFMTITLQENRIIVFGQAGIGFYVEGFRADTGKNLFRFSNSY